MLDVQLSTEPLLSQSYSNSILDVEDDDDDAEAVRPGDVLSYSVHKLHERLDEVNEGSWVSLGCYHWHSL